MEFSSKISFKNSAQGFGLIEVMIAMALMLVVAMGMSNLINNMQKEQKKQSTIAALTQIKTQLTNVITNETSWKNTVGDSTLNPNMGCLRAQKRCDGTDPTYTFNAVAASYATSLDRIVLKDGAAAGGAIFFDGRSASTQGFTETGAACSTFTSAAAGNDNCPVGYIINWRAVGTIANPQIVVVAKMVFNPSANHPMKNFFNAPVTSTTLGKYDIEVMRTASSSSKQFSVVVLAPNVAGPGCATQGFGSCNTGGSWSHYGSGGLGTYTEEYDPFDLVAISSNHIQIRSVGAYRCTATTFAFATDAVRMGIERQSPSVQVIATTNSRAAAASFAYTTVTLETLIDVQAANSEYDIVQTCEVNSAANCSLGFNSSGVYGAAATEARASLVCVLVE